MTRNTLARIIACGVCLVLAACSDRRRDPLPCASVSPVAPSACPAVAAFAAPASASRILPDFHGRWAGECAISACHESGDLMGFCDAFAVGAAYPVVLRFDQEDVRVDGTLTLGGLSARVRGTIDDGGALRLADADTVVGGMRVTLGGAILSVVLNDDLRGSFRTRWTRDGAVGEAGFNAEFRFVTRAVGMPASAATPLAAYRWQDRVPALSAR